MPLCPRHNLSEHAVIVLAEADRAALRLVEGSFATLEADQRTRSAVVDLIIVSLVGLLEKAALVLAPEPGPAGAQLALAQCIAESIQR